ncbi:glycosyltransferase family 2 protein [Agrobacterium larrymoorei]|uniref:glycosyltransferase family 2 protein n=1 Tax=Agrobacterium larrymoorei TaxID=160699 RepID=UPI001574A000|nr:glycosyltransferase family 2 protein [Agrobacterium larrymoorei]NTJ44402.1 glycosyltransferase family 2 protein [Agrobacterium larrymoorei]
MTFGSNSICVIIAAKNASDTISTAISSALAETEVSEVVVIDDGSTDATSAIAQACDDGSGRLKVERFDVNRGPSAARNHAIAISSAPLISILDADDFFFKGRFTAMLADDDWDLVADNIAFIQQGVQRASSITPDRFAPDHQFLNLTEFVEGNISKRGLERGETGFLKPVIRRSFLEQHNLRYDEPLRLGEDYELYVRALACGARYKVIRNCGYGAIIRGDSLSGRHRTEDLRLLYEADRKILEDYSLTAPEIAILEEHERHIRQKFELRDFLDAKAKGGLGGAVSHALARLPAVPAITSGIWFDKTARLRKKPQQPADIRYLLKGTPLPS